MAESGMPVGDTVEDPAPATTGDDSNAAADRASSSVTEDVEKHEATGPASPASTGKRPMADEVKEEKPAQAEENMPPRKKAKKDSPAAETAGSVDEGEVRSSDDVSRKSKSSSSDAPESPSAHEEILQPPPAPGTTASAANTPGVATVAGTPGLRTSFGTSAQKVQKSLNNDLWMYNPMPSQARAELSDALRKAETDTETVKSIKKRELEWTVNPISPDFEGRSWLDVFNDIVDKWCRTFVAVNQEHILQVGLATSFLKQAFMRRLENDIAPGVPDLFLKITKTQLKHPDTSRLRDFAGQFKPDAKKIAKRLKKQQARLAKATASEQSQQPTSASSSSPQTTVNDASGENIEAKTDEEEVEPGEINDDDEEMDLNSDEPIAPMEPLSRDELEQRHRYFPGLSDDAVFCLTCAQHSHATAKCPELTCKFCQGQHFKYECPTRQRCAKCKQLGHTKASCKEKLAVAPGEATVECAICEGHDHTEQNCSQLWQIYRPRPNKVKKVKSLPIFCYCCGAKGHYGGDCGIADRSIPPTKTWTTTTASIYIDPTSEEPALAFKNPLDPPPTITAPVIPGRSIKPQSHVIFEESDDEDDMNGLIRGAAATSGNRSTGKIQIASNISFGGPSATTAAGPSNSRRQQQQNSNSRYPQRKTNPSPNDNPPPPPRQGGKNYPLRNGKKSSKAGQGQRREPPLPPGPPPRSQQGGGRGSGNRGRGGFSGLGRRNRGRGRGS